MMSKARILIAEDDPDCAEVLTVLLEHEGFVVSGVVPTGDEVIEKASLSRPDLVLMDIGLQGQCDGIKAASQIQSRFRIPVVYITGRVDEQTVTRAIATDPFGYLTKPVDMHELRVTVELAIRHAKSNGSVDVWATDSDLSGLVGSGRQMTRIREQIVELASLDTTILIEGETGTGKERVAQAIHSASRRKDKPFITINCPALSDSLLASQLFGHRRGASTGAAEDRQGFFEAASGGTIFLDEIASAPLCVQTSLLRVLEEREIVRLGDTKPRKVDVRVLAATNRDHERIQSAITRAGFNRTNAAHLLGISRATLYRRLNERKDRPNFPAKHLTFSTVSGETALRQG